MYSSDLIEHFEVSAEFEANLFQLTLFKKDIQVEIVFTLDWGCCKDDEVVN